MQNVHKTVCTKSRKFCSVPQCNSYCTKDISLHHFPTGNPILSKKWQDMLKVGKDITKNMFVCSLHFVPEDYTIVTPTTKIRRLKSGVIPSQKIPLTSHQTVKKIIDRTDRTWLKGSASSTHCTRNTTCEPNNVVVVVEDNFIEQIKHNVNNVPILITQRKGESEKAFETFYEDKSTQTDFCDFFELPQILNTDNKMLNFTGVDFKVIDTYKKCVTNVAQENGITECKDNLELKIILVLCKLKLNISFACLAILFNISKSTCTRIFHFMISLLAFSIKPIIYWPKKDEILRNMPKCFDKYMNTRVVLDCTEIKIQKLNCLKCRIMSYSHYKGTHTVKFLIGVTPSGLISYISPAYGGRASDKAIFNEENVIDFLDPYDAVMVDKGILIENECNENYVKLIRPPFLRKKKQFSKKDAEDTANIARARVHVERAIQRLKTFKILSEQINWYLLPYINDIMTVIASTVNLSPPILANDKFSKS